MRLSLTKIDELNTILATTPVKGMANLVMAENMNILSPHVQTLNKTKDALIKQHSGDNETLTANHPNWAKFWNDYNRILKEEAEFSDLKAVKRSDLNFDKEQNSNALFVLLHYKLLDSV